jgi:hypothetical protein
MWEPQPLATLRASTACTGITLPYNILFSFHLFSRWLTSTIFFFDLWTLAYLEPNLFFSIMFLYSIYADFLQLHYGWRSFTFESYFCPNNTSCLVLSFIFVCVFVYFFPSLLMLFISFLPCSCLCYSWHLGCWIGTKLNIALKNWELRIFSSCVFRTSQISSLHIQRRFDFPVSLKGYNEYEWLNRASVET